MPVVRKEKEYEHPTQRVVKGLFRNPMPDSFYEKGVPLTRQPSGVENEISGRIPIKEPLPQAPIANDLTVIPKVAKGQVAGGTRKTGGAATPDLTQIPDFGYPENVGYVLQGSKGHTAAEGVSPEDIGKFVKASDKHTKWYFDQQGKGGGDLTQLPEIIRGDVGDTSRAFSAANRMKILNDVDLVRAGEDWEKAMGSNYKTTVPMGASRAERVAAIQAGTEKGADKSAYLGNLKGADAGDLGSFATGMGDIATNRMLAETGQAKNLMDLTLIPSQIKGLQAETEYKKAQTVKEKAEAKAIQEGRYKVPGREKDYKKEILDWATANSKDVDGVPDPELFNQRLDYADKYFNAAGGLKEEATVVLPSGKKAVVIGGKWVMEK